jgi:glycosyltransferase involved in cell wall biosynthesis
MKMTDKSLSILYVSSISPLNPVGGGIGTRKFYYPLLKMKEEGIAKPLFIWADINGDKRKEFTRNKDTLIFEKSFYKSVISRFLGKADFIELHTDEMISAIKDFKVDVAIIQSSRLGAITEKLAHINPRPFIIQNFDNFEYEFAHSFVKTRVPKILRNIEFNAVKNSESKALKFSDTCIFLTENDRKNVFDFYQSSKPYTIMPIFYPDPLENGKTNNTKLDKRRFNIIFTGSLNYYPNIEAATFLIDWANNIFEIDKRISLIIAGREPHESIEAAIANSSYKSRITLVPNPSEEMMNELLSSSHLYISPVFEGSGMKTKVIEALAHGLPIIASEHSLIGYEELLKDKRAHDILRAFPDKNKEKFMMIFEDFYNEIFERESTEIFFKARDLYKDIFGFSKFYKDLHDIIFERGNYS